MIGRTADIKYKDTETGDLPLEEKIFKVLEQVLPPVVGRSVNPVPVKEEQSSDSDDDY